MRISAPLCAVALSLALTPPASSSFFEGPAPTDRAAYLSVQIPATASEADKKGLGDAIKTSCPDGQLATTKDEEDVYGVFWGFHRSIQLFCLGQEDGKPGRELNRDMNEKGAYGIILYKGTEKERYHLFYGPVGHKVWVAIADPAPFPPAAPAKPVVKTEPTPPPKTGADAPVKLSEADLKKLPQPDRDAYNKAWDDAKTDDAAKRDLNTKYSGMIAKVTPTPVENGSTPATESRSTPPSASMDFKTIKTQGDFSDIKYTDSEKKAFCSMVEAAKQDSNPNTCTVSDVDLAKAMADCKAAAPKGPTPEAVQASIRACYEKQKACGAAAGTNPASDTVPTQDVRNACKAFAAIRSSGKQDSKGGKSSGIDGEDKDCGKTAGKHAKAAGSDAAPCETKPDKPDMSAFYGDLSNGVALGLAGMVLGSFFGGPLVFAAFALAAGVGGYYLSKSINKKDDSKKGS